MARENVEGNPKTKDHHVMIVGAKELSDTTMRRYFTIQLSVIGWEGSTKSICHIPLLTKQARNMLE